MVNISILSKQTSQNLDKGETNFRVKLNYFSDTNLSKSFKQLKELLYPLSRSLPTLIVNKSQIVSILLQALSSSDSSSYKPAFELLTALAQDLRSDFDEFDRVMETFTKFIDPSSPELLELIFVSICHLIKFLEKSIILNFRTIFRLTNCSLTIIFHCYFVKKTSFPQIAKTQQKIHPQFRGRKLRFFNAQNFCFKAKISFVWRHLKHFRFDKYWRHCFITVPFC